jgi:hypothetical protein
MKFVFLFLLALAQKVLLCIGTESLAERLGLGYLHFFVPRRDRADVGGTKEPEMKYDRSALNTFVLSRLNAFERFSASRGGHNEKLKSMEDQSRAMPGTEVDTSCILRAPTTMTVVPIAAKAFVMIRALRCLSPKCKTRRKIHNDRRKSDKIAFSDRLMDVIARNLAARNVFVFRNINQSAVPKKKQPNCARVTTARHKVRFFRFSNLYKVCLNVIIVTFSSDSLRLWQQFHSSLLIISLEIR